MKVLSVNTIIKRPDEKFTLGGVEYHRIFMPHTHMKRHYGLEPDMAQSLDAVPDETLKTYDLVIFVRTIAHIDHIDRFIERLTSFNIPFGIDIDDYWHLPESHISYDNYIKLNFAQTTEYGLQRAAFVMCTTPFLAEKVKEFNQNVYVVENAIDFEDDIWQPKKTEFPRMRFGFTQGNTHFPDLLTIHKSVIKAINDIKFRKQGQIVLTGFSEWMNTGQVNVEMAFEMCLTDGHKAINKYPDLVNNLYVNKEPPHDDFPYRRIYGQDVMTYANIYNEIDVSVVPLIDNTFNNCKSELKMLEAGAKGCACIVDHVKPYTLLATDKNSFDLKEKTFFERARILIKNPNLALDSAAQLRQDIQKYSMTEVNKKRNEIYNKYKK